MRPWRGDRANGSTIGSDGRWNYSLSSHGAFETVRLRRMRLLIPVVVSFLAQVPSALFRLSGTDLPQLILGLAIALVGPVALLAARRFPGPVVAVVAAAASADLLSTFRLGGPPYIALAFAVVGAIVRGARVWAWVSVACAWAFTLTIGGALDLTWQPARIAATTLGLLIVIGIGEAIRTRRERDDHYRRIASEQRLTEVQAERVRIARELHDVLAHSLSQINVQASVGLHLAGVQPEKAAEALASIKESSKTALDDVRTVLGILRSEDGDHEAPLVPEPDLSRLPGLVASVSSDDLAVRLDQRVTTPPPASVQLALYRIAQEALTNVVRHSGATEASVTVEQTAAAWVLTIDDNGRGGPDDPPHVGAGRGLLGMRERAELLDGFLEVRRSDGFRVVATIPVPRRTGSAWDRGVDS